MYLQLIPSLRLPRTLNVFDYTLPDTLACRVKSGSVVMTTFRHQITPAVVWSISDQTQVTAAQLKPIQSVVENISFSKLQRQLIDQFARDFLISPGTVVNMIIGEMPRRGILPPTVSESKPATKRQSAKPWLSDSLVWHRTNQEKLDYIIDLANQAVRLHKHLLIIGPEIRQVRAWENVLSEFNPLVLHRQLPRSLYWQRFATLSAGQPSVVIGTRSALFLPHQKLDLIIIDAEDNPNHRQTEMNPRYHTEQVARLLKSISGANIHWISQAPRLSTWHAHRNGELELVDLRKLRPAPSVLIEDMNNDRKLGNRAMLSERLQRLVTTNLKAKRLTVLYLNRRGESTGFICKDCNHSFSCPRCVRPLILHRLKSKGQVLTCHLCEYSMDAPAICPICHGTDFKRSGWRLQLLETDVRALYPEAKITVREAGSAPILPDTDIIVGTQIILTPEILERAGLIAFVSVDQLLALPDFSAPEQVFRQILLAVSGANSNSTILFQSFKADHYALQHGSKSDLDGFYSEELKQRAIFHYPPYSDLARLILKGKVQKQVTTEAERVYNELAAQAEKIPGLIILHASPAFVAKTRGQYRWELVLKYPPAYWPAVRDLLQLTSEKWLLDLQPQSLL